MMSKELDDIVECDIEIVIDAQGNPLPEKHDLEGLTDADTIAYNACLACEEAIQIMPRDFYTDEEWEELINNPTYIEAEGVYYDISIEAAVQSAEDKMQKIMDKSGCKSLELHFSSGKDQFRYKLVPDYKANRVGTRYPAGLKEVKEALAKKYNGTIHTQWEADDAVIYLYNKFPEKYVLIAVDKDVYNSVPGRHFNYFECNYVHHLSGKHVVRDMGFIEVTEAQAKFWPYKQCILGDPTDGIAGVKGIGEKTLGKFINEDMDHVELWDGVVAAYKSKGMSETDAKFTMYLVNMHQLVEVDGQLTYRAWEAPVER